MQENCETQDIQGPKADQGSFATISRETKRDPMAQGSASFAPPREDILKYISELGIGKVQLSKEDIETILDTLIYDEKVERSIVAGAGRSGGDGQVKLCRSINPLVPPTGLMRMPCGSCPVFDQCYEGGAVSPTTCVYIKDWLAI